MNAEVTFFKNNRAVEIFKSKSIHIKKFSLGKNSKITSQENILLIFDLIK